MYKYYKLIRNTKLCWQKICEIKKLEDKAKYFMEQAIKLAEANITTNEGGPFGAVIVKADQIIASGKNQVIATNDPSAHAEIMAIRQACQVLQTFQLYDCDIYTSCEPCPMCLGAIYWARLAKVYYANTKQAAAAIGFDDNFIYQEIARLPLQRTIPFIHLENDMAKRAFEQWVIKSDKTQY